MSKSVQFAYNTGGDGTAYTVNTRVGTPDARALISGGGYYPRTSVIVIEYRECDE